MLMFSKWDKPLELTCLLCCDWLVISSINNFSLCCYQISTQKYNGQLIHSLGRLNRVVSSYVINIAQTQGFRIQIPTSCVFSFFVFQNHI